MSVDQLELLLTLHLKKTYVQQQDERQKAMGLSYTEAETSDLAKSVLRVLAPFLLNAEGYPMDESTPKDRPILAWCDHNADPLYEEGTGNMTLYGAHGEGMSYADDGFNVIVWGGGWTDGYEDGGGHMPDWWFVKDSEFEKAANPVRWWPLPPELALTPERSEYTEEVHTDPQGLNGIDLFDGEDA